MSPVSPAMTTKNYACSYILSIFDFKTAKPQFLLSSNQEIFKSCYTVLCVKKKKRGVILLGDFGKIRSQYKGGHTPCQDIYGKQLFVM